MKNITYGIAVVLVIAAAIFFLNKEPAVTDAKIDADEAASSISDKEQPVLLPPASPRAPAKDNLATPAKPLEEKGPAPQYEHIASRLDAMQQRRPHEDFDPAAVAAAVQRPTAWTPAEEVPEELPLEPDEFSDGRQFIQFDSLKLETLMPGDNVEVSIEELGEDYTVVIDEVKKHDYSNISWYGHIDGDDGQIYSVSFTRGDSLTVGGLSTPDGHYVLQAHGNNGWIASSGLLYKIDPNVPDVIYPEDVMRENNGEG
jgi:hypothetical protein